MFNFVKFVAPFLLGAMTMMAVNPEFQRLSDANYEERISSLSSDLSSCQTKILEARKALE